ncbi:hypothetical protein HW115_07510 [Verrucomicrobiaceae bacterium N1E253]|uniref:Lipoprotein n=1 Tax=Oceaniferula marina TaxID=2748318 RepID=A0A851GD28_9BACT|nr:hypothetical protein [Oceaniferula marina]NWK55453.1 hypothetical protein [Oceaniferula marina]
MKFTHITLALLVTLGAISCEQKKEETQRSIQEKAKRSSSKQPEARPETGIPADKAARRVGTQNDQRAQKSRELLDQTR